MTDAVTGQAAANVLKSEIGFFSWEEETPDAIHIADAELNMGFGLQSGTFKGGTAFGEGASY